ncbi:MAG: DUF4278 domain-containing protein [Thermosynechococcaceae cyanobacterium]
MQLTYRGVNYEYIPPQVETKSTGVVGKYRGLDWRFRNTTRSAVQQPTLDLVYRGVPYQTGPSQSIPAPVASTPPVGAFAATVSNPVKDMARALMMSHHALVKNRQQSMLGRAAAEVGLAANASH